MNDIQNQKVASAVLASRTDQHVSESNYRQFAYDCARQAAAITRAELEAVLRECRESLDAVTKWNAPPDFNGRKIDRIVEKAIAKIEEVLNGKQ